MSRILLNLDLSTKATGWSKFDLDTKELLEYGVIYPRVKNPRVKGVPQYVYPEFQLRKIRDIIAQICTDLLDPNVEVILIEETNRGISRLGQKVLCGLHFVLIDHLFANSPEDSNWIKKLVFVDSDGKTGWRSATGLNLILSDQDKFVNNERRKLNKKIKAGNKLKKGKEKQKLCHIITKKDLACRYVNRKYGLKLDVEQRETDGDIADAIGLGCFYLNCYGGLTDEQ